MLSFAGSYDGITDTRKALRSRELPQDNCNLFVLVLHRSGTQQKQNPAESKMAETPIRFAKGSAVWCQTTPVNYHDAVVLEDCVEGDAEAVVRYTTAARVMRVAVDKVIPIGDARPRRSTTKAPVPAVSPARAPAAPRRKQQAPRRRLSRGERAELEQYMRRDKWTTTKTGRDPYYSKPGESKQYRSLLAIARAHYPDVLHVPLDSLQMLSPPYNGLSLIHI